MLSFDVLGRFAVTDRGRRVDLGPPKQQLVLAVLLSRAGEAVPAAALAEAVWGEAPPASAPENLRLYVHRLRRALNGSEPGGTDPLSRNRRGYLLSVDADAVDAHRFVGLVTAATAALPGDPATARERLGEALDLWREPPYGDLAEEPALAAEVIRLREYHVTALHHRIDLDLARGLDADLVPELVALIGRHPYREHFRGQHLLALYRSGRRAEALAACRAVRAEFAAELGVDPGPELLRLERAILRGDPGLDRPAPAAAKTAPAAPATLPPATLPPAMAPTALPPATLPPAVGHLVGRAAELAALDAAAAGGTAGPGMPVVAVVGPAGVGKTALALHWGHSAAGRFPDGQLFADLRGFDPARPLRPIEALARFLLALGVRPDGIPPDVEDAAGLYRSLLAGKRMLVVLDNARSGADVRPLLPGTPGCLALVTSRERLSGLVASHAARRIALPPLPRDRAVELLGRLLRARVTTEPSAAAELAELCGQLPLALCIAAANLADGRSIAGYVDDLRAGDRLAALRVDDEDGPALTATFDLSYASLPADAQRAFRRLGLLPGPDVTTEAAAVLCDTGVPDAARTLDRLVGAHLLQRHGPDRFALHDLLREYARQRATASDHAALHPLYDHYIDACRGAARALYPQLLLLPRDRPDGAFTDGATARAWLAAELPNLVALAEHGPPETSWLVADALRGHFWQRRDVVPWRLVAAAARQAVDAAGDPAARASVALSLGQLHYCRREYADAVEAYAGALELCRQAGWRRGESVILGNLASVHGDRGDLRRAAEHFTTALAIQREIGYRAGEAVTLGNLGLLEANLGNLTAAATLLSEALALHRAAGSLAGQAVVLGNLGDVEVQLGRYDDAAHHAAEALTLARRTGRLDAETLALIHLSAVDRATGEPARALRRAKEALDLIGGGVDPAIEAMAINALAAAYHRTGDLATAIDLYQRARRLAGGTGSGFVETEALIGLAGVQAAAGRIGDATEQAGNAVALARAGGFGGLERRAEEILAATAEPPD